jgi:hypothetical protein
VLAQIDSTANGELLETRVQADDIDQGKECGRVSVAGAIIYPVEGLEVFAQGNSFGGGVSEVGVIINHCTWRGNAVSEDT